MRKTLLHYYTPVDPELKKLFDRCDMTHLLYIDELHDGALVVECRACPYRYVLMPEDEENIRKELDDTTYV